jgi:hypothetical protein
MEVSKSMNNFFTPMCLQILSGQSEPHPPETLGGGIPAYTVERVWRIAKRMGLRPSSGG